LSALIGYARVSTHDQDAELQRVALERAGCLRLFEETASGAQRDRPQLAAALDYLRPGDTLVVWKLDRLARSLKQLIETVELLDARGAHFRSLTETIETGTPGGRLVFSIFGALAEFERSLIRERTMAGLATARAKGRVGGRPRSITPKRLKAAEGLLKAGDLTVSEVAQQIGVSPSTLYRYLPAARASTGS
jgi:DNA invertase Pin-like site-specific DNA recombinase